MSPGNGRLLHQAPSRYSRQAVTPRCTKPLLPVVPYMPPVFIDFPVNFVLMDHLNLVLLKAPSGAKWKHLSIKGGASVGGLTDQ